MPTNKGNIVRGIYKGLDPGKGHGVSNPDGQFFNQRDRGGAGGMGIYNGKGPYDVVAEEEWEDHLEGVNPEDEMTEEEYVIAVGIHSKTGQTGHIDRSYQSMDRKGVTPFSGVPDATGAGHTGLRANNNIEGSLIFEGFLKEYIYEVLNENRGSSMSANYYLNKAGHGGKLHPPESVGPPLSPGGGRSYNVGRITQKPRRTATGVLSMNDLHSKDDSVTDAEEFENGNSTFYASKIFFDDDGKIYKDELNVSEYNPHVKV